jgi:hypothetical protein|tara:strand:+ start:174 stop:674 length:501 start_codon:yes stop_codon:yes gene_type:complete
LGLPSDNDSACALPQGADDGAMKFMVAMVACVMLTCILQADEKNRDAQLEAQLTGTVFKGVFTIDGRPGQPAEEEYTILKVKKAGEGDLWFFTARIKYGNKDVTLPVPVPIKWAGKTPVIEMDNLKIPLLGTFSAHIVIDDGKYAGTWKHGKVGGHMYGKILKIKK